MDGNRLFNKGTQFPIDVDWIRMVSLQYQAENHIMLSLVKGDVMLHTYPTERDFDTNMECYDIFANAVDMFSLNEKFLVVLTEKSMIMYYYQQLGIESQNAYHLQSGARASAFKGVNRTKGNSYNTSNIVENRFLTINK